jgi:hypothetical protein
VPLIGGRRFWIYSADPPPGDRDGDELFNAAFDQLEFLDASGIRLLLDLNRRSRMNGGRLRIRPASSPQVPRVLELTGVGELLPIQA